jgi:hypothetical protein
VQRVAQRAPEGLQGPSGLTVSGQVSVVGAVPPTAAHCPLRHSNPLPPRGQSAVVSHGATHTFGSASQSGVAQDAAAPRLAHSEVIVQGFVHAPHRHASEPQSLSVRHWSSQWVLLSVPEMLVDAQDGTTPIPRTPSAMAHVILAEIMGNLTLPPFPHSSELSSP